MKITPLFILFFAMGAIGAFEMMSADEAVAKSKHAKKKSKGHAVKKAHAVKKGGLPGPKAIPENEWVTVAGPRAQEKYTILKGDTLSELSIKLFGDKKYWPKIWSLNNSDITNPHRIKPGYLIAFSGDLNSPLSPITLPPAGETHLVDPSKRSTDWKRLPKQSWESFKQEVPIEIDPLGFDSRNKFSFHGPTSYAPDFVPATDKFKSLGQIIGSRTESSFVGLGDAVYIRQEGEIQIGETYAITQEPALLKSTKSDRVGYSYMILGQVKILGFRDKLFVGTISNARDFVPRGTFLIPLPARVPVVDPIPAPRAVLGTLMLDRIRSTSMVVQYKSGYVNRGSQEGVKPGMIFRAYQHHDPSNDKKISSANFIIDADMIVTQVSETFCSVNIIRSFSSIREGAQVVLLTDISDIGKNAGFRQKGKNEDDLDDLDQLDNEENLGDAEKRELKQLEKWNGNGPSNHESTPPPPEPAPEPSPSSSPDAEAPAPTDSTPPVNPADVPAPILPDAPPEAVVGPLSPVEPTALVPAPPAVPDSAAPDAAAPSSSAPSAPAAEEPPPPPPSE